MAHTTPHTPNTLGDAAVDGLFAGGVAGISMGVYLLIAGLAWGDNPAALLGRFDPGGGAAPVVGLFTHLAVSAVYGAIFALGWRLALRLSRMPVWLAAALYGVLLWLVAVTVFLPAAASPLLGIPSFHFALSHGIYGLTLGLILARRT